MTFRPDGSIDHDSIANVIGDNHHTDPTAGSGVADEATNQFGWDYDNLYGGNVHVVSSSLSEAYSSVQTAHDDLPASGGTVRIADTVAETAIDLTKPIILEGVHGAHRDHNNNNNVGGELDTSGGDGVHIKSTGVTIRNLHIKGDGTSWGIRLGEVGKQYHDTTCENVVVRGCDQGFYFNGQSQYNYLDIRADDCTNEGFKFDIGADNNNYFEASNLPRIVAAHCGSYGIVIEGGAGGEDFSSNFMDFTAFSNSNYGFHVSGQISFKGNTFVGHGCENNSNYGVHVDSLEAADRDAGGEAYGNHMMVMNSEQGVAYNPENWDIFNIAKSTDRHHRLTTKENLARPGGRTTGMLDELAIHDGSESRSPGIPECNVRYNGGQWEFLEPVELTYTGDGSSSRYIGPDFLWTYALIYSEGSNKAVDSYQGAMPNGTQTGNSFSGDWDIGSGGGINIGVGDQDPNSNGTNYLLIGW